MNGRSINIGIYGRTWAGKTRFLRELLNGWYSAHRIAEASNECLHFLKTVDSELEHFGRTSPTTAATHGIRVVLKNGDGEPVDELHFRDLRGELLTDELKDSESLGKGSLVSTQVQKCDGFLFLVDPALTEEPSRDPVAIEKHHADELRRAALFVEYTLENRQNRHLPIIFVQTHLDEWEDDEEISQRATQWFSDVIGSMNTLFEKYLKGHFPAALVDAKRTSVAISCVRSASEVEKPITLLRSLVDDSHSFADKERKRRRWYLFVGVVALAIFALVFVIFGQVVPLNGPPTGESGRSTDVSGAEPKEVDTRLRTFERLLNAQPRGDALPKPDEAKEINKHLSWFFTRLPFESTAEPTPREDVVKEITSLISRASKLIHRKIHAKHDIPLEEQLRVFKEYLADLGDHRALFPELADAQQHFWQLQRQWIVEQLSEIIMRREEVGSLPEDAIAELLGRLKGIQQDLKGHTVFGATLRDELTREVDTAITFLDDRTRQRGYYAMLRVKRGSADATRHPDPGWRSLVLESPGRDNRQIGLEPRRSEAGIYEFHAKRDEYRIDFSFGDAIKCVLAIHSTAENKWRRLHEFDIAEGDSQKRLSLAPLGMPLIQETASSVSKGLQWEGYEFELEFYGFPNPPMLLWDAVKTRKRITIQ